MSFIIKDGSGQGYSAKVNSEGAIKIIGETQHIQHHYSRRYGQCYHTLGTTTLSASGNTYLHHIRNDSYTHLLVVVFVRFQGIGFVSLPSSNVYMSLSKNLSYSSGGNIITPTNTNFSSSNLADVSVWSEPTLTGSAEEIERWYIEPDGRENIFEEWGAVILGQNDQMTLSIYSDQATGSEVLKTRINFLMVDKDI